MMIIQGRPESTIAWDFECRIGTLQGCLGCGHPEVGLPLDVLRVSRRARIDANVAENYEDKQRTPEHLIVPGPCGWLLLLGKSRRSGEAVAVEGCSAVGSPGVDCVSFCGSQA